MRNTAANPPATPQPVNPASVDLLYNEEQVLGKYVAASEKEESAMFSGVKEDCRLNRSKSIRGGEVEYKDPHVLQL